MISIQMGNQVDCLLTSFDWTIIMFRKHLTFTFYFSQQWKMEAEEVDGPILMQAIVNGRLELQTHTCLRPWKRWMRILTIHGVMYHQTKYKYTITSAYNILWIGKDHTQYTWNADLYRSHFTCTWNCLINLNIS